MTIVGWAVLAVLGSRVAWGASGWVRLRLRHSVPAAEGDPALGARLHTLRDPRGWRLAAVVVSSGEPARIACLGGDADTPFEIGSLTKAVLGLVLAECAARGEVDLDGTLGDLDPTMDPVLAGIGVRELSTHTSGLPRLGTPTPRTLVNGLAYAWLLRNPYRGITPDAVRRIAARSCRRRLARRGEFRYSNLGASLLGQTLARACGCSFGELLHARVLGPLGMEVTTLRRPPDMALGVSGTRRAALWPMDGFAPAGGLCSTPRDLARLLQALADGTAPGIAALGDGEQRGLLWQVDRSRRVAWHNGQTGGYSAHLEVALEAPRRACAVIADVADAREMATILRALERETSPAPA